MKIFDFITEINRVAKESIPGDTNIEVNVQNDGETFGFDVMVEYTDPGCILITKRFPIAYVEVKLDSDLSFIVVSNSVYPDFTEEQKAYDLSEFSSVLKGKLEHERAQILFRSIIGK